MERSTKRLKTAVQLAVEKPSDVHTLETPLKPLSSNVGRTLGLRKNAFRKQLTDEMSVSDSVLSEEGEDEKCSQEEVPLTLEAGPSDSLEEPVRYTEDAVSTDSQTLSKTAEPVFEEQQEEFSHGGDNQRLHVKKHRVLRVNKNSKTGQVRTSRKQRIRLQNTRVCIVGAGMAGMSAARRLHELGVAVTVYEARNRVGGRVCSVESDGVNGIDVGASWIHGIEDNPVFEICEQYDLVIYAEEVGVEKTDALYDVNGEEFDKGLDEWGFLMHQKHQSEAEEYGKGLPDWEAIQLSLGSLLEPKLADAAQGDARKTRILNWHMANIEYSTGASATHLGLPTWDQDDLTALQGAHVMIQNGYQTAVEVLTSHIDVRFEQIVTAIEYDESGVKLYINGVTEPTMVYDFCIVTAPLGVLKASVLKHHQPLNTEEEFDLFKLSDKSLYSAFLNKYDTHVESVNISQIDNTCNNENSLNMYVNPFDDFGEGAPAYTPSRIACCNELLDSPILQQPSFVLPHTEENAVSARFNETGIPMFAVSKPHDTTSTLIKDEEMQDHSIQICKASVGCIKFCPPLPEWKVAAIGQVGFGLINKIALVFPYIFWDTSKRQLGWASNIRGQYPQIILLHPKPALLVLLTGRFSVESESRSKASLVREALTVLRLIHGGKTVPTPVRAFVSRWGSDPFARGSYSYVPPGVAGRDYDTLSFPVKDRLLFGGEHTMRPYPSTVHGACASGRREADRITDWVTGKLEKEKVQKWFYGPDGDWYSVDLNDIDCQAIYIEDVLEGPTIKERIGWFSTVKCAFCGENQTIERPFSGCVRFKDACNKERRWAVHEECCYYSPEVGSNNEGSRWYNVAKALKRSASTHCAVCRGPGATIGCSISDCNCMVHLPCARKSLNWPNYIEPARNLPLFCPDHQHLRNQSSSSMNSALTPKWKSKEFLSNGKIDDYAAEASLENGLSIDPTETINRKRTTFPASQNYYCKPHTFSVSNEDYEEEDSKDRFYSTCRFCNGKGRVVEPILQNREEEESPLRFLKTSESVLKPDELAAVLLRNTVIVLLQFFEQKKLESGGEVAVASVASYFPSMLLSQDSLTSLDAMQAVDTHSTSSFGSTDLSGKREKTGRVRQATEATYVEDASVVPSAASRMSVKQKEAVESKSNESFNISSLIRLFTTITGYLQKYRQRQHLVDSTDLRC